MPLTGTVLVTGGAGFIGSHIAEAIAAKADRYLLDDLSTGHRENGEAIIGDVDFIEGSVADSALLSECCRMWSWCFTKLLPPSVQIR